MKLLTVLGYGKFGCYFGHCPLSLSLYRFSRNWICLCYHKYCSYAAGFHTKSWAVVELAQVRPKFTSDLSTICIHLYTRNLLFFSSVGVSMSHQTISTLISNFRHVLNVVCFLLGNSPPSEFYMPTNSDKFRYRGITQKKTYNTISNCLPNCLQSYTG